MHYLKTFSKKTIALVVGTGIALMLAVALLMPAPATAAGGGNMFGYLWSSNIGWVSLNCNQKAIGGVDSCASSNYYVNMASSSTSTVGVFSGYAWSPNIGWISFNAGDVASCGAQAKLDLVTNKMSGWAKVLSWGGCISFSSTSPSYGAVYNPNLSINNLTGFAWGSTNVGWLGFTHATLNIADVDLTVNGADTWALPATGGPVNLAWTTHGTGTGVCTATGDWTGSKASVGGTQSVTIPGNAGSTVITKTFTITCTGFGSTALSDTVTVTVAPATGSFLSFLVNGTTSASIIAGDNINLTWQVQNLQANSCKGTSSGAFTGWNNTTKTSSPNTTPTAPYLETIPSVTTNRTYTISGCLPTGSSTPLPAQTVTITVLPASCEVIPAKAVIAAGTGPITPAILRSFGASWINTGTSFPTINITAGSVLPSGFGTAVGTITGGSVTATGKPAKVPVTSSATVTGTQTILINGTPTTGAPASSCTPATLYIVPPGYCQDPCADNVGQLGSCHYSNACSPNTKRPPWEEI